MANLEILKEKLPKSGFCPICKSERFYKGLKTHFNNCYKKVNSPTQPIKDKIDSSNFINESKSSNFMPKRCDNCVAKYVYKTEKGFNNHVKLYHMCSNDSEAVGSISSDSLTFVPKSCEYCNSKYIYKKLNGYNKHILTKHSNQISSMAINSNSQFFKEFNFSEEQSS